MAVFWISAVFALAFASLFVRDLRGRSIAFASLRFQRAANPAPFWAIVGFELIGFLVFGAIAITGYFSPRPCKAPEKCVEVTISMVPSS